MCRSGKGFAYCPVQKGREFKIHGLRGSTADLRIFRLDKRKDLFYTRQSKKLSGEESFLIALIRTY